MQRLLSFRDRLLASIFSTCALLLTAAPAAANNCAPVPSGAISWWAAEGNAIDMMEGDVAPRFNLDRHVTLIDWVQLGRFAARLDYPSNALEFQAADCAPRSTLGDGRITVADWVQAGRNAAGLDPLTAIGGPTSEVTAAASPPISEAGNGGGRPQTLGAVIQVLDTMILQGQTGTVSVILDAQGNENALGFTVSFDPSLLTLTRVILGSGASIATVDINASEAGSGRLGFVLALSTGSTFAPGIHELVEIIFQASTTASGASLASLGDQLVPREVSDAAANALFATYLNGTITVNPPPVLNINRSGQNVTLLWPFWATNFVLQQASGLPSSSWTNLSVLPTITNNQNSLTVPVDSASGFYRLLQQH